MSVGSGRPDRVVEVYGFHGTSAANAEVILTRAVGDPLRPGLGFEQKDWSGHWLGQGVYFFQDAPRRAWAWARERHGDDAAVLGVLIYLPIGRCIDLLDTEWGARLWRTREAMLRDRGMLPRQRVVIRRPSPHPLDCLVIDALVDQLRVEGHPIDAVRSPFPEGRKVYARAAYYELGHVQLAVRNRLIIQDVWAE